MQKFSWRFLLPLLLVFLAACGDLAGTVEIVGTVTPSTSNANQAFELPPNAPNIANGQAIFMANCTRCHGASGVGNGELVESGEVPRMPSFLEASHVRQENLDFYYDIITNGNIINLMPPWSNSLSLQERWDVAAYVYTLQYTPEQIERGAALVPNPASTIRRESDAMLAAETGLDGEDAFAAVAYQRLQGFQNWGVAPAPLPENTQVALESLSFVGTVTHGTAAFSVPAGLAVQLRYGNETVGVQVLDGNLDANNQFRFDNVPYDASFSYFAVASYQERGFFSEFFTGQTVQASNTVAITLYEVTQDPSVVTLTDVEFRIESLNVSDLGTGLLIHQTNVYNNFSDRMFILQPEGQSISVSVLMQLPVGASILNNPNNPRFIIAQNEFALIDLQPVYPGTHVIEADYFLPYEDGLIVDIPINNNFNGSVTAIVAVPELRITSDFINFVEESNFGTEENPFLVNVYAGTSTIPAGESIVFDIDGKLPQTSDTDTAVVTQDQLLPVILIIMVVVFLLGIGLVFALRARAKTSQSETERILAEIRQLEDLHEAGRLNHDAFQQKRQALKKRLAELMAEQKPDA